MTADLVEVDLVDRPTVEGGLDLGQRREGGQRPRRHPGRQPGLLHQTHDVRVRAHHDVVLDGDDGAAGGDTAPQHGLDLEGPPAERQSLEQAQDLVESGSGVDEAAERHVPGDAGEAVEPGDGPSRRRDRRDGAPGVDGHGSIRARAHAAPKPLSIPTTVIPAAHEACMASRAVTPSRAAP